MDVESQTTLDEAVDRAAARLTDKVVPALEAALGRQLAQANADLTALLDRAASELSSLSAGTLQGLQAVADKAARDMAGVVDLLDGVTLRISLPPVAKP